MTHQHNAAVQRPARGPRWVIFDETGQLTAIDRSLEPLQGLNSSPIPAMVGGSMSAYQVNPCRRLMS